MGGVTSDERGKNRLAGLYPTPGPWTSAALWFGRFPAAVPSSSLGEELETIHQQRLAGALLRYARAAGVPLEPDARRLLQQSSLRWMSVTAEAARNAGEVVRRLQKDDVPVVVSKGPGIARWYPAPDCRPFSDIDLLVPAAAFNDAAERLGREGWLEDDRNRQPRRYMRRHCREGLNLTHPDGGSIDLHHRLPPWIWSRHVNLDDMFARADDVLVHGDTLPCLAPVDNAVVAALHVVSDNNRPGRSLRVWRDLVEDVCHTDATELASVAEAAGLAGWMRAVISALPREFIDTPAMTDVMAALPHQPLPHPSRLNLLLSGRLDRLGVFATQTLRLPPVNAVLFAAGMVAPSREFVHRKFAGDAHPYRRWYGLADRRTDRSTADS